MIWFPGEDYGSRWGWHASVRCASPTHRPTDYMLPLALPAAIPS